MGELYKRKVAYVTGGLVLLNVLYFLYLEAFGSSEDLTFMIKKGAMYEPLIENGGQYYRFITAMFMHFGIDHLVNNMLVLFILGDNLERAMGKGKYFAVYMISGIGANVISYLYNMQQMKIVVSAGASGAVFGVIGALIYVVTANRGKLEDLTTQRLVLMVVFSLYFSLSNSTIDHVAHVSGLLLGILVSLVLYRRPRYSIHMREGGEL